MNEWITIILLLIGGFFILIAAVGILRMPDLFTRMHAVTTSSTAGVVCIILGTAVYFGDIGIAFRSLLIIVFLFLTAPVATHMISRAAYFIGEDLCDETIIDELKGKYDKRSHEVTGKISPPAHHPPRKGKTSNK